MQASYSIVACIAGEVDASSVGIWGAPPPGPTEVSGERLFLPAAQPQVA